MFTVVGDETNQWMKLYMFCYEVVFVQIQVIVLQYNTHTLMIGQKGQKISVNQMCQI